MHKYFWVMILFAILPPMIVAAQTPMEKPALNHSVLQQPMAEKIGKQLRPWLAMEVNDFHTLWNVIIL